MKILIVGASKSENTEDLKEEAERRGFEVRKVQPSEFIFSVEKGEFKITGGDINLLDFDVCLLRGYNLRLTETRIFAEKFLSVGKVLIDDIVGRDFIEGKLFEASKLTQAGLNYPKTYSITSANSFEKIKDLLTYPVIVKPVCGRQGKGIEKIDTQSDLAFFLEEHQCGWLIQEYLPMDGDVRVFVVGGKVLGAIKRSVIEGDFRSNVSLGADAVRFDLDEETKDIALKAVEAMKCDIAGVDLVNVNEKWYILEVSATPQWQAFKKLTGINPAEHIIDYAVERFTDNCKK